MTKPNLGRGVLWILPVALVVIAFFAALPWLKAMSDALALTITAAVVVIVMGYANYLAFRAQRGLDEVQQAGAAFATRWGASVGQAAFGLLLVLPPFKDAAVAIVGKIAASPVDGTVVLVSLALAFCTVVILQAIGTVVVQAFWWTAKQ